MFDESEADETLLSLREELNPDRRRELLGSFLKLLSEKHPAVFLYSPDVSYVMNSSVKGFDMRSANGVFSRLSDIEHWYIETKRVWKK
jgi:ABC-type transport system substrate-binding protein